jgi:transposase
VWLTGSWTIPLDQLGRTVRDTLNLVHELRERGVDVRTLAGPLAIDSSETDIRDCGRMVFWDSLIGALLRMTDRKRYSQKYKDDAVELVISSGRPIAQVAPDIGVNEGTRGTWVRKYREDHPDRFLSEEKAAVPWDEHQKALAENAKLKQ